MRLLFGFIIYTIFQLSLFAQSRERINFDDDWQFRLGDIAMKRSVKAGQQGGLSDIEKKQTILETDTIAYTDRNKMPKYKACDWKNIRIPHDWLVEIPVENNSTYGSEKGVNGFKRTGIGFYRKEFILPEYEGKKTFLEFDGIFRNSTVWINGHEIGTHKSGYIPAFYDITDFLRYGDEGHNVILVKVDATDYEGWWYEGCGIYRHVWLIKTDRLHVDRYGTYITTPTINKQNAIVSMKTTLKNEYGILKKFVITSKIINKGGEILDVQTDEYTINAFQTETYEQTGKVLAPNLWSPENPYLYKVLTEIKVDGQLIDNYETNFGIRTAHVTKDGFFLNGKLYPIKGTANHQDHAGVGVAVPDKLCEYRIKLLKEMGSNAYRSAHNPSSVELLNICDSLGMLVMCENRFLSSSKDYMEDLKTLILRDRNHPCVFMWCLENEEKLQGTKMGARILRTMHNMVHALDSTRQTTAAMNHGWNTNGYSDIIDVVGYNYGQRRMQYVNDKKRYPERKMIVTESTSFISTRGEYVNNEKKGYVSNFSKGVSWGGLPGEEWQHVIDYPYLSGAFVWTGFDYRGEPTPYSWPCTSSHFGIMDLCGFPKDCYYAYKSAWTSEDVIHLFPHWNHMGHEGDSIKMGIYTNCEEIELRINGKSLGRRVAKPNSLIEWNVVYQPGIIEAVGYRNGRKVTADSNETTDEPSQISLNSNVNVMKPNGTDIAVVNVAVKDKEGRIVPTADNFIEFKIEGPGIIIGTGNGNPSSHELDILPMRHAFNGLCQLIVQALDKPGKIQIIAESEGLKSEVLNLEVK